MGDPSAEGAFAPGGALYDLFAASAQPMWLHDPESRAILAVNDAALAHLGCTREEFLATTRVSERPGARTETIELDGRIVVLTRLEDPASPTSVSRPGRPGRRELEEALERGEFTLHYQPVVPLTGTGVPGAEALVRWRSPTRGMVMPSGFIGIAEETGFIVTLGRWVFRRACEQLAQWEAGAPGTPEHISVNVSPRQLNVPGAVEGFLDAAGESGVDPASVSIEITESSLLDDLPAVTERLEALRHAGFRISLDDIGTQYSTLSYLRRFPFDAIKIDRSFVAALGSDRRDRAIVGNMITLGHELGLEVVVEGVETEEQLDAATRLGADWAQGFLFSKPLPGAWMAYALANLPRPPLPRTGSTDRVAANL